MTKITVIARRSCCCVISPAGNTTGERARPYEHVGVIAGGGRAPPTAPPPPASIATASADPKRSHPRTREFPTARRSPASTRRSASAADGRIAMEIGLLEGSAAHTEPNGVTEITSAFRPSCFSAVSPGPNPERRARLVQPVGAYSRRRLPSQFAPPPTPYRDCLH